jgi:hypothetical protein
MPNASPQIPQLPDPKTAYDHLFQTVHSGAFFNRLAQRGINVTSPKQAADALATAEQLRSLEGDPRFKAANDSDPFAQARAALDKMVGGPAPEQSRKQAAVQLMNDADIYNSILSLKSAEAARIAQQLQPVA